MACTLVTGVAGFIGFHVAARLLDDGHKVVGLDNLNDYYDVRLKRARLARLQDGPNRGGFTFSHTDLADRPAMAALFAEHTPELVVHLAAQAGVRYSLSHPEAYVDSNLTGLLTVLEGCRAHDVKHLVFASSSSVYGANTRQPFSEHHATDHPVSLYAATKRAGELLCHSYAHLYGLPVTALRFFTVYGPWGRPDMAPMRFAGAIRKGLPIDVYNEGRMRRDFTEIADVVEGVVRVLDHVPAAHPAPDPARAVADDDPAASSAPFALFNLGRGEPVELLRFIELLEQALGRRAERRPQHDRFRRDDRHTLVPWVRHPPIRERIGCHPHRRDASQHRA